MNLIVYHPNYTPLLNILKTYQSMISHNSSKAFMLTCNVDQPATDQAGIGAVQSQTRLKAYRQIKGLPSICGHSLHHNLEGIKGVYMCSCIRTSLYEWSHLWSLNVRGDRCPRMVRLLDPAGESSYLCGVPSCLSPYYISAKNYSSLIPLLSPKLLYRSSQRVKTLKAARTTRRAKGT